jgi:hypothetical protein
MNSIKLKAVRSSSDVPKLTKKSTHVSVNFLIQIDIHKSNNDRVCTYQLLFDSCVYNIAIQARH